MLQAYFDASGTGDREAHVIAGYIATADTWAEFSKEWKSRLGEAGLQRFKMNELAGRMEVAAFFYRAIEQFDILAAISCVVRVDHLATVVNEIEWPDPRWAQKLRNPYHFAFRVIVEGVARDQIKLGLDEPITFIFDNQNEAKVLTEAWDLLKFAAAPQIQLFLGDAPSFQEDEEAPPLQAADLYAWWVLKWQREGDAKTGVHDQRFDWEPKKNINRLHMAWLEKDEFRNAMKGSIERAEKLRFDHMLGKKGLTQEVKEGRGRTDFKYSIRHLNFEPQFFDDRPPNLKLQDAVRKRYSKNANTAQIFIQNRDDGAFSAAEMLSWFLKKSNTSLEDHVPGEELAKALTGGTRRFRVSFPINLTRGSFHVMTNNGPMDLKRLTLLVEYTIEPKRRS